MFKATWFITTRGWESCQVAKHGLKFFILMDTKVLVCYFRQV